MELLAGEGGDLNLKDPHGNTALHLAAAEDAQVTVSILIKQGALQSIRDDRGRTPLMTAIESGSRRAAAEINRHMVAWQDIEEIIGKKRLW